MKLKERLNYFWNVTLGEDIPEDIEIKDSKDSSMKELKESLKKIEELENTYKVANTTSKKGGKSPVVETVVISPKAIEQMQQIKDSKQSVGKKQEKEIGE